jgi:hypothetical protein
VDKNAAVYALRIYGEEGLRKKTRSTQFGIVVHSIVLLSYQRLAEEPQVSISKIRHEERACEKILETFELMTAAFYGTFDPSIVGPWITRGL